MAIIQEKGDFFYDFDIADVYDTKLAQAKDENTRNFVVEFGKDEARIAMNLDTQDVQNLLSQTSRQSSRPVRWFNIWAPNQQTELVGALGTHYKFSPRLLAIIQSRPQRAEGTHKETNTFMARLIHKDDIETGRASIESNASTPSQVARKNTSHYGLAEQMINYQSIDVGGHYLCIGANWLHETSPPKKPQVHTLEAHQRRLWTWLVLCDDNTVISLHEDTRPCDNKPDLISMRRNTLSVLSQLSKIGHDQADPISMQTVRQVLELDEAQANPGIEGASNLFYYLFDDWRAVYATVSSFQKRLHDLQQSILEDMPKKSGPQPDIKIIPSLHVLGQQIRQKKHLYEGYKNLIQRILEPKATSVAGTITPGGFNQSRNVTLAASASQRFERLGDRIQLLILSETSEFLDEKDALIATYFNITAQKDSEATARLTRSATLLAKLSVLFLPVSLMTSYFSTQVKGIDNYTVSYYWSAFAIIVGVSFLFLFFFSRLLMWGTEVLDEWAKDTWKFFQHCLAKVGRALNRKKAAP